MKQFSFLPILLTLLISFGSPSSQAQSECIKGTVRNGKVKLNIVNLNASGACPNGTVPTTTGPTGPTGIAGAPGASGASGASAFNVIPSGTTVRGIIGDVKDLTNTTSFVVFSSLNGIAPVPPADAAIIVKANPILLAVCPGQTCLTPNEQANQSFCTGTSTNPTAPAGAICIYPIAVSDTVATGTLEGVGVGTDDGSKSKYAFSVQFTTAFIQNQFVGIWAYTAP